MMRLVDCQQGTPEWFAARLGIPTASEFHSVLAKGEGKTRRSYMLRLAGERLCGDPADTHETAEMVRGREMEPAARAAYAFFHDASPQQVGFILNGDKGCSPDALIGADGMLEIKTKKPALHIECVLKDQFPPEHKAQCQGGLWVAEREWIDLAVYWPKLPLFVKRAYRDEAYIRELAQAVDTFNSELNEVVERVRRLGGEEARAAA